jgi:sugar phosphate isomerase/epimerase
MHATTSSSFPFRAVMEGYAKAGIRAVEVNLVQMRAFTDRESPAVAQRLLADLGLKVVACSGQTGLVDPNPARPQNLEDLKWKCELMQGLGCDRLATPSASPPYTDCLRFTESDYERGLDNLREAAEIARPYGVTLMLEFIRLTNFCGSLPTALKLVRAANHPNARVMLDTFHFWTGVSKLEDLELLGDRELHHLHFLDVPASPVRELLEQRHRVFPGRGIAPLGRILAILKRKKYGGPASVEMADPVVQAMDPYQVARDIRASAERLLE